MKIIKITKETFEQYANNHSLRSYLQTYEYAEYYKHKGYSYEFVGLVDDSNEIHGASLILYKKINYFIKYGYAPKGFLINYYDEELLKTFTSELTKYYYTKNFAFIKVNPDIAVGVFNKSTKGYDYNKNKDLIRIFENNNFVHLNSSFKFENIQPMFNAIIPLNNFDINKLDKSLKNKIKNSYKKGFSLVKGSINDLDNIYKFIDRFKNRNYDDYIAYCRSFGNKNMMDYFLVKVDFEQCLLHARDLYQKEIDRNSMLVNKLAKYNTPANLKRKMASDELIEVFKNDIILYTQKLANKKEDYIAGAITVKYQNRIYLIVSGYDTSLKRLAPNNYLYYKLCDYYKNDFDFIELNGISGEFDPSNPYYGLNKFKLSFNPICFQYIGEFDYIINPGLYKTCKRNGYLAREFKKDIKN